MKKAKFTAVLAILTICFLAVPEADAQSSKQTNKIKVVKEGVGFEGIRVGKSTMADIVKKFGKDYKWVVNKKYSYQMTYAKLGLAFYMCQSDQRKEVFDIELRAPFQAKTSKGVTLGKSTLEEIYKIYGKTAGGLEYRGVSFFYANFKGKKTVTVIDIVENAGIRQCQEKPKPKPKSTTITGAKGNSPFTSKYVGGDSAGIVIENSTNKILTRVFGGVGYSIPAKSSETMDIEPGTYDYTTSVPGVRSISGTEGYQRGYRDNWNFYIVIRR